MSGKTVVLDGLSLTCEQLLEIGYQEPRVVVEVAREAWERVAKGRTVVDSVIRRGETVYGINTGFGLFSNVHIDDAQLAQLQVNLIRSHSAGTGKLLSVQQTRMLLALRINVLAKGNSGIRPDTVEKALAALNNDCLPAVPEQGTVGASGDLAPLSHLALGLLGEGKMWDPTLKDYCPAIEVLERHQLTPVSLTAKEGLALINGTQLITSIGSEAWCRARRVALQADVIAAMTVEVLKGTVKAFHPRVHQARPHVGQNRVAGRLRSLLHSNQHPSVLSQSHANCGCVQDSYSLRCIPQIHGVVHDTIGFVQGVLETECNSATDNPMIFTDLTTENVNDPDEFSRREGLVTQSFVPHCSACGVHQHVTPRSPKPSSQKTPEEVQKYVMDSDLSSTGAIISGGNFHGEYPAKMMDFLAIGVHELSQVSERRIERLVNPVLSNLPAFLVKDGGLNSGFMIAHCTAAALVSENKGLCHPSSVDSLSTSAAKEDHVSMGGWAARKALKVVEHVEKVLAIELLCACQALDLLRPLTTTEPLEAVYEEVRKVVRPWDCDRQMSVDIEAAWDLVKRGVIWDVVKSFIPAELH